MAQNSYMSDYAMLTAEKHGRLIVSGGDTIAEFYEADVTLPTLYVDETHKPFLECVITKGTFINLEAKTTGVQDNKTVVNIANGTSVRPQGLCVLDAFRPFESGEKFGVSFITEGYVEFPIIHGLNDTIAVGDEIACDSVGRPVKYVQGQTGPAIGRVKAVEHLGDADFDTGMLEYMSLPYETLFDQLVRRPLELQDPADSVSTSPLFGYRANLDVANVEGAFRVQLYKL